MRISIRNLAIALVPCVAATPVIAETISGRVTFADGRPAPARIEVVNVLADGCANANRTSHPSSQNGSFSIDGPPSIYSLKVIGGGSTVNPMFRKVDTRGGSVSGLAIELRSGRWSIGSGAPPLASRITVGAPDTNDMATVRGAPGAVPPSALVVLLTLETGHYDTVIADTAGAFEGTLFAPRGSHISVKIDETGLEWQNMRAGPARVCFPTAAALPGTIVTAAPPVTSGGIPFASASTQFLPLWQVRGTIDSAQYPRGGRVQVEGTLTVDAKSVATTTPLRSVLQTFLEAIHVPGTLGARSSSMLTSHLMTPTGFPIERLRFPAFRHTVQSPVDLIKVSDQRASGSFSFSFELPPDLKDGYYRLVTYPQGTIPFTAGEHRIWQVDFKRRHGVVRLPMFRVGDPPAPHVPLALLMDQLSNATQGIRAREDRMVFGIASRIATQSDTFIVPRLHPISGEVLSYRLEPFLPSVSMSDRDPPEIPMIPFRLPSGTLRVTLTRPDGATETIGPAPLLQAWPATIVNRHGHLYDGGGGQITEAFRLTTLDPRFEVTFPTEGLYTVRAELSVDDEAGNRWTGEGTFEITVGTPLTIDTTVLPGTAFEVGDELAIAGEILPPRAADIEAVLMLGTQTVTVRGRANAFGFFRLDPITLAEPGEYRFDITATHRAAGKMAAGSRTWGGVVAPRTPAIVAHGARATDGVQGPTRPQWFLHSTFGNVGADHVPFPFQSGDVSWVRKGHSSIPALTFQDLSGSIAALLRQRDWNVPSFERAVVEGEIPFFSTRSDSQDPHLDPARVDLWSYAYTSVQRPLVRVREEIGELQLQGGYWRFGEQYAAQMGVGPVGDQVNDFKFQFGGGVIRGSAIASAQYAIYGSLWVAVADNDPMGTRTFPPFQGNGGGPSGGPLFRLKGEDIDLFFHPTGIRPGSIVEEGDTALLAGYVGPPLPARIEMVVTSPSGSTRTIAGMANRAGWFYEPAADFVASERGVWKVRTTVTFEGQTSAGPVSAPFPVGDVLGSREGEFHFYVTGRFSQQLDAGNLPRFVELGQQPVTFNAAPAVSLTNATLCHTATMPGFILDEGCSSSMSWTWDAKSFAPDFPNLDLNDVDGAGGADAVLVSLFATGTDSTGGVRHFARRVLLNAGEVQLSTETIPPRRRAARH